MKGTWVGVAALTILIGSITYSHDPSFWAWGTSVSAVSVQSQLAQAATGGTSGVRKLCKGGETLTISVTEKGLESIPACNLPTNTCEVVINAPGRRPAKVTYCCDPETGGCQCKTTAKSCDETHPMKNKFLQTISPYKYKCTLSSTKSGMATPASQVAAAGSTDIETIECDKFDGRFSALSQPPANSGGSTPATPATPATPETSKLPNATLPQSSTVTDAFKPPQAGPAPTTSVSPSPGSNSAYQQIQAAGSASGAQGQTSGALGPVQTSGSGAPLPPPAPGQPTQVAPTGPAFRQGTIATQNSILPVRGPLATGYQSNYYGTGLRAQTTFPSFSSSGSGYGGGGGSGIVSLMTSFFSGFLSSVSSNPVVTLVQSLAGSPSPVVGTAAPPSQPRDADTPHVRVVVVPYQQSPSQPSTPASSASPAAPAMKPMTPAEIEAAIIAIANQKGNGPRQIGFRGETPAAAPSDIPAGLEASYEPGTRPTVVEKLEAALGDTKIQNMVRIAPGRPATTAEVASTSAWSGAFVVETGMPATIGTGRRAGLGSIISFFGGGWTGRGTLIEQKAALAQAQVDYDAAVAQTGALQEARGVGLCDSDCSAILAALESELPARRSNISELDKIVQKNEAIAALPAPALQIERFVAGLAHPADSVSDTPATPVSQDVASLNARQDAGMQQSAGPSAYEQIVAQASSSVVGGASPESQATVTVSSQPNVSATSSETAGEGTVLRIVSTVWETLKSWFTPRTAASTPQHSCSLFATLFQGCK